MLVCDNEDNVGALARHETSPLIFFSLSCDLPVKLRLKTCKFW